MKLNVPVYWRNISLVELRRKLDDRNSAGLLKSINGIIRKGYLPAELCDIIDPELGLDEGDDILYAKMPSLPLSDSQLYRQPISTLEHWATPQNHCEGFASPALALCCTLQQGDEVVLVSL